MNPEDEIPRVIADESAPDAENHSKNLRRTSLPWRSIGVLYLLSSCQPLAFELIFPFVNQMILEIGVVDDPERVGFYSGLIESIFACMSFLAIMPCTYISDRYGRKPVILFGITGLAVSTSLFGLSHSFWFMVLTRCLGGALGGTWSAIKIMVAELTDKTNQGSAFSGIGISYRVGQIVGQPLGGFLAHPEQRFPFFQSQFWYDYPYSLPCFVAAGLAMISVLLGSVYLQETLESKRNTKKSKYGAIANAHQVSETTPLRPDASISKATCLPLRSALTPQIVALMFNSMGMVLASESIFALYPLFAFTPVESGGLGLSEATIGTHMAIRALNNIAIMTMYGPLERWLGSLKLYKLAMFIWPVSIAIMPVLNIIARNEEASSVFFNTILFIFFTVWSFACLAWTGIFILINDATPSANALATISGISQMAIVLPQGIAPAFANSLFAYSISSQIFGGNLIWVVLIILTTAVGLQTLTLKRVDHDWRDEYRSSVE